MTDEFEEGQEEISQNDDAAADAQEVVDRLDDITAAAVDFAEATVQPLSFGPLGNSEAVRGEGRNLDLLLDVGIPISVEVGRSQMSLDEILNLAPGSVVPLDKKAEEPVDLRVNGKLVAQGEVVLIDDSYGLRITQIIDSNGRIESLR